MVAPFRVNARRAPRPYFQTIQRCAPALPRAVHERRIRRVDPRVRRPLCRPRHSRARSSTALAPPSRAPRNSLKKIAPTVPSAKNWRATSWSISRPTDLRVHALEHRREVLQRRVDELLHSAQRVSLRDPRLGRDQAEHAGLRGLGAAHTVSVRNRARLAKPLSSLSGVWLRRHFSAPCWRSTRTVSPCSSMISSPPSWRSARAWPL